MSQESTTAWREGELVRVRGDVWRIVSTTPFPECTLLDLAGIGRRNAGTRRVFIAPFDCPTPLARTNRPIVVKRTSWMRAFRTFVCQAASVEQLKTAATARLDLLPYQLEPALALVRGHSTRFLLADEVGLGKTIQAGLMLAELRARGQADRVLVLTPAGLRDQWAAELSDRFSIDADIVDSHALRRRVASLPRGINPWSAAGVSIVSFDFVKQPEVLRPLLGLVWDLVLVDEAHMAVTAVERVSAVRAVAARAWQLVLITATPHAGDEAAFSTLCNIGRLASEGPIAMFRRSRAEVGRATTRRVTLVRVTPTSAEQRMHEYLQAYSSRVWREASGRADRQAQLAMMVLCKRGLSSAGSLLQSIERRLALLGYAPPQAAQQALPFTADRPESDDEDEPGDREPLESLGARGLDNRALERDWLRMLRHAAAEASHDESKIRALTRFLCRTREAALVFTEYRDTLERIAARLEPLASIAVLHGGLTQTDRRTACRRFSNGDVRILLATDAAGQGLNLQSRCRLVINMELPWNPVRLEQRIGRVDRIGQRQTVHACHLLARDTQETHVLGRLVRRLARARESLGDHRNPSGVAIDERIAAAMIDALPGRVRGHAWRRQERVSGSSEPASGFRFSTAGLGPHAIQEASRVAELRQLRGPLRIVPEAGRTRRPRRVDAVRASDPLPAVAGGPWVTAVWKPRGRPAHAGLIALYRVQVSDESGRLVEEVLVPVRCRMTRLDLRRQPRAITEWLNGHWNDLDHRVRAGLASSFSGHVDRARAETRARSMLLLARGRALVALLDRSARVGPIQAGLFDRRALCHVEQIAGEVADERAEVERRLAVTETALTSPLTMHVAAVLVLLTPRG